MANKLEIFSLNCWGLKYVARDRQERILAIAEYLAASNYDIVGLQELWVYSDYQIIRNKVSKILPYSKFFYGGALGAGLALLSQFPILSTTTHAYSLNGTPLDVAGGDWFVGKSAGSIVIEHPALGEVEIFNTHLYAKGGEDGPEEKRAHRLVNVWELAKLVRNSARLGRYVILMGDFNNVPNTLPMRVIREHGCLTDAWIQSHPRPPSSTNTNDVPTPQRAIRDYGITADSPLNSYSAGKPLDAVARRHQGKRLDYVFFRHPSQVDASKPLIRALKSNVTLSEMVPGYTFSYSDHFGLEVTFEISPTNGHPSENDTEVGLGHSGASPAAASCISEEALEATLEALTIHYRKTRKSSRNQLFVFAGCLTLAIGFIVSSAFLPRSWINPIYIFFTVFVTWLGTTMLYSGFIHGSWEARALTNAIEDLELFQQSSTMRRRQYSN